jgi:hypothetical protein
VTLSFTNSPIHSASETSRGNAAALGALWYVPSRWLLRIMEWQSPAPSRRGSVLRPSSAPILFEAGCPRGPMGVRRPGAVQGGRPSYIG